MLQIQNLTVRLTKNNRTLIRDLSFSLNPGDRAVLLGEEGNGKSTLLKLLYDPALVEGYAEYSGEILRNRLRPGYLPQELPPREQEYTLREYFDASPGFAGQTPRELAAIARSLRLPPEFFDSAQRVGTLSGGEKVKIQLTRILLEQPDVLLLDEPSNDLDLEALTWLEEFIRDCPLPLLFISHDETLIERCANMIIHFEQLIRKTQARHTVVRMPYRQYARERLARFAHQTQLARKEKEEHEAKERRWQQIYERVKHEQNTISRQDPGGGRLLKKKMKSVKAQERRLERDKEEQTKLPDFEEPIRLAFGEGVGVPAGKLVLDLALDRLEAAGRVLARDIKLCVRGGAHVCLIGPNGSGKTTLLRRIAGELLARPDLKAAYMPQDYAEQLDLSVTPAEFLAPGGHKDDVTRARLYLGSQKYTPDEMEHSVAALSGGQKAKLFLARFALLGYNVLILDEPTRNLSPLSNPIVREALRAYQGAVIAVSHDRKFIAGVCDAVWRLTPEGLLPVDTALFRENGDE